MDITNLLDLKIIFTVPPFPQERQNQIISTSPFHKQSNRSVSILDPPYNISIIGVILLYNCAQAFQQFFLTTQFTALQPKAC